MVYGFTTDKCGNLIIKLIYSYINLNYEYFAANSHICFFCVTNISFPTQICKSYYVLYKNYTMWNVLPFIFSVI